MQTNTYKPTQYNTTNEHYLRLLNYTFKSVRFQNRPFIPNTARLWNSHKSYSLHQLPNHLRNNPQNITDINLLLTFPLIS